MSLGHDIRRDLTADIRAAKKIRLPGWALLCLFLGGLPALWLFDRSGRIDLFLPAFNCVAVLSFVIAVKRALTRHAWFWGSMGIFAALHALLIVLTPWTTKWVPALAIAAIDSADFVVMLAIIDLIARWMTGARVAEG